MNSRERVKRAIHFDKPDRLPKTRLSLSTDFYVFPLFDSKKFQPINYPPHVGGGTRAYKSIINRY